MRLLRSRLGPGTLADGEMVVLRVHRHWSWLARDVLLPSIFMAAWLSLWVGLAWRRVQVHPGLVAAALTLGAVWILGAWLSWASRSLTLTTRRILADRGVLRRDWVVVGLARVVGVAARQSLLGSLLGYGSLLIVTAGVAAPVVFEGAPRPRLLQDQILLLTPLPLEPAPGLTDMRHVGA